MTIQAIERVFRRKAQGRRINVGAVGAATAAAGMTLSAPLVSAQQSSSAPQGLLVVDPQRRATTRPLLSSPLPARLSQSLPATEPSVPLSMVAPAGAGEVAPPRYGPSADPLDPLPGMPRPKAWPQGVAGGLPTPSGDPMHIDPDTDPILRLAREQSSLAVFRQVIGKAIVHNPALDETSAQADEAKSVRDEARARRLPVVDLSLSTFQIVDRAFSNDPNNVLERSRPRHRTDSLLRVQQPLIDFGVSRSRIRSSEARLNATRADVEDVGTQVALRAVSVWYAVYGYRVLVRLGEAFANNQRALRGGIEERIRQGAVAAGDAAQVDSYIASSDTLLSDFQRQLTTAEAQYTAVIGSSPPADLARAPVPSLDDRSFETISVVIDTLPAVRAAKLGVDAAQSDVRASKSDLLPQVFAGIDAGRYGIIETGRDYDIRGSLTLSMRLGGGGAQRVEQAEARARGAEARLRRTRIEAQRDAQIALADVKALQVTQTAIEDNYLASRRSRDVLAERFRVSRGTLFDLLAAESNFFSVATRYVQTVIELDTARYTLLARTGRLLPALGIQPATLGSQ